MFKRASPNTAAAAFRRRAVLAVAASFVAPVAGFMAPADAAPKPPPPKRGAAPVEIVSADLAASSPSVSADGRFVVFSAAPIAAEIAYGSTRTSTIWLRDRFTGQLTELTPFEKNLASGDSVRPAISADGCYVTFITQYAYDLFRDDDIGKRWDVYRRRTPNCGGEHADFELVSIRSSVGTEPTASNDVPTDDVPAISGAGGVVAYTARFGTAADSTITGVNVVDFTVAIGDPGRSRPVAGTPDKPPNTVYTYRGLRQPTMSDDGQLIGYLSDARSATVERSWATGPQAGKPATTQAFVWDRSNFDPATAVDEVSALSKNPDAAATADGAATAVRISGDGRFVAVASRATNLVPGVAYPRCTELCPEQIYRVDRLDGSIALVSKTTSAAGAVEAADLGAMLPTISFDGNEIAFVSRSTNLFLTRNGAGTGAPSDGDVLVASIDSDQLRRVSVLADGVTPAPPAQSNPAMSANGRVVVFDTAAAPGFGATTSGRSVATVTEKPVLTMNDLDLGTVSVGFTSPEWYIPVRNEGPSTFVPAEVTSTNADFVITGGTCDQGEPIAPGGSCTVNLVLLPSAEGPLEGVITVAEAGFNRAEVSATVRGAGGVPALNPTQAGHSFDPVMAGQYSMPRVIEVRNVGIDPAPMGRARITGAQAADFRITADNCRDRTLPPSGTCSVDVVFGPKSDGVRNAALEFFTAQQQYTTVLLSGSGTFAPELVTNQSQFTAGRQFVVGLRGFRPFSVVQLAWADGRGRRVSATTNQDGNVLVLIRIGAVDPVGERTIVATGADGLQASKVVRVVAPVVSQRATSPAFADG